LAHKNCTRAELDHSKAAIDQQLAAAEFECLSAAFFADLERKFLYA
jgi:hypothetical protein